MEDTSIKGVRESEWYIPQISVHDSYEDWLGKSRLSLSYEVREKVSRIIATHQPVPFSKEVEQELTRIQSQARKFVGPFP